MRPKFAQYGISHAHAAGKVGVLKASREIDFAGVYEPDPGIRATRGSASAYAGVDWLPSRDAILEDSSISAIAVEGEVGQNLAWAREALDHGKHVWLDKPAGSDWTAFQALIALAKERGLQVQLGYMFRYNPGIQFIMDWANSGVLGHVFGIRGRMSTTHSDQRREQLSKYAGGMAAMASAAASLA